MCPAQCLLPAYSNETCCLKRRALEETKAVFPALRSRLSEAVAQLESQLVRCRSSSTGVSPAKAPLIRLLLKARLRTARRMRLRKPRKSSVRPNLQPDRRSYASVDRDQLWRRTIVVASLRLVAFRSCPCRRGYPRLLLLLPFHRRSLP